MQEHNIIKSVEPITKYSKVVENAGQIERVMFEAFLAAASGRKGPSWIDLPADVQHQGVSETLISAIPSRVSQLFHKLVESKADLCVGNLDPNIIALLRNAERPMILLGGGVSNDIEEKKAVVDFITNNALPVATTYAATDVISHDYDYFVGAVGVKGNRAANFAVQNCDLLIVLGSRLPFAAIGYDVDNFARQAKIIVVDIDTEELRKNELNFEHNLSQINCYCLWIHKSLPIIRKINYIFTSQSTSKIYT